MHYATATLEVLVVGLETHMIMGAERTVQIS